MGTDMAKSSADYFGEYSGGPGVVEAENTPPFDREAVLEKIQTLVVDEGVGLLETERRDGSVPAQPGHTLTAAEQRMAQARAMRMEENGVGLARPNGGDLAADHLPYTEEQAVKDYREGQNY